MHTNININRQPYRIIIIIIIIQMYPVTASNAVSIANVYKCSLSKLTSSSIGNYRGWYPVY